MPGPVSIKVSGRFFRDGPQIVQSMAHRIRREAAEAGESHLHKVLRPRPSGVYLSVSEAKKGRASTGHYRRNVHALDMGSWFFITDSGVVYGPWLEFGGGRFRGYASFRRTAIWIRSQIRPISNRVVQQYIDQLNGG